MSAPKKTLVDEPPGTEMILGGQISTSSLQKSLAHIERPHHVGDPEPWLVCKGTVVSCPEKSVKLGGQGIS